MQRLPIKDDNLRLVLSKDHGKWLDHEIRDRWVAIVILLAVFAAGSLALYQYFGEKNDARQQTSVVYMDHDATETEMHSMSDQGFTVILKNADGSLPGETEKQPDDSGSLMGLFAMMSLFFMLLSPFLIFFIGKALLEIMKLNRWKSEHADFLASYNRAAP